MKKESTIKSHNDSERNRHIQTSDSYYPRSSSSPSPNITTKTKPPMQHQVSINKTTQGHNAIHKRAKYSTKLLGTNTHRPSPLRRCPSLTPNNLQFLMQHLLKLRFLFPNTSQPFRPGQKYDHLSYRLERGPALTNGTIRCNSHFGDEVEIGLVTTFLLVQVKVKMEFGGGEKGRTKNHTCPPASKTTSSAMQVAL